MNWLDKLERKLGRFAIRNLMIYIIGLNGLVYLLMMLDRTGTLAFQLRLIPELVFRGEVWRLVSYIFIPPATSPLWIVFILYFYYFVGNTLEQEWGSFRFNIYYLLGIIATTVAAMITGGDATAGYLNLSLFLAFAYLYPDHQVLLFFILPIKVKYLGWFNWVWLGYTVITGDIPVRAAAVAAVINFIIFFGPEIIAHLRVGRRSYYNRQRFSGNDRSDFTIHRCCICGKTEKTDPKMDFRYCAQCEGDYEYCMEHLKTHQHKGKENLIQ